MAAKLKRRTIQCDRPDRQGHKCLGGESVRQSDDWAERRTIWGRLADIDRETQHLTAAVAQGSAPAAAAYG